MYTGTNSKTIHFNGKEYNIAQLTSAIATSPELALDRRVPFHELSFDQELLPVEWKTKYKVPVLTMIEGKYVFIVRPEGLENPMSVSKIRFVSKFALNQSRVDKIPVVEVHKPTYESNPPASQRPFNPPRFANTKPTGNGYQGKPKY